MRILFNEVHLETVSCNLLELLDEMQMAEKTGIAVAVNDHVIPKNVWKHQGICENDAVLVITAAAGG